MIRRPEPLVGSKKESVLTALSNVPGRWELKQGRIIKTTLPADLRVDMSQLGARRMAPGAGAFTSGGIDYERTLNESCEATLNATRANFASQGGGVNPRASMSTAYEYMYLTHEYAYSYLPYGSDRTHISLHYLSRYPFEGTARPTQRPTLAAQRLPTCLTAS